MTIEQLGNIGELIGAVATVATLLYLALQIRANTRATKAEARRANRSAHFASFAEIVASDEVAQIYEKGLQDRSSLTSTERLRFDYMFSRHLGETQLLYEEEDDGFVSPEVVEIEFRTLIPMVSSPGGRAYWTEWRKSYLPGFRERIDRAIASSHETTE